jgi:flavorubredoxin
MCPVEIKPNVFWVGALDWEIRDFHGYSTYKGSTYNAYLIKDEKITLVDTVRRGFSGELLERIREVIDPTTIDYLIVNHVEMDHSGSLPEIMELVKPEKLFCSPMGKKALLAHFHREDWPYEVVATGQSLSLGQKTVQFMETRMLHWPDSMFSYLPEDRLLISSDAFGQHWATSERFDDEVEVPELFEHAAKYYANILLPYSPLIQKLLGEVKKMGLDIDMIAPDHGLIWRTLPANILAAYDAWSKQEPNHKAVVLYDTMWHSTETMARHIGEGLRQEGVNYQLHNMRVSHRSDVVTEILDAKAIICGSATLNNSMMPNLSDLLVYLKGLRPLNKIGAAFGSYGWSGEAVKQINQFLEEMKIEVVDPGLRINYVPTADDLQQCLALGQKIGRLIKEGNQPG